MSTYYLPALPIPFEKIEKLKTKEIWETKTKQTTSKSVCLTDGKNHLWAGKSQKGFTTFSRWGSNDVSFILETLEKLFEVELVDEYGEDWEELVQTDYSEDYESIDFDE